MGRDVVLAADDVTTEMDHATQTTRVSPLDLLTNAGAVSGITSVDLDGDAYLRRMPDAPDSFAAEALRMAGEPRSRRRPGALIQSFGPPRTYPTVSYYQALDPERFLPRAGFKDRVVFVGLSLKAAPDANGRRRRRLPDALYPVEPAPSTAGVEVQATILDNLRHAPVHHAGPARRP